MKNWKDMERDVAKLLGAWWSCTFRRTPGSGAWGKQGQSRFSTNFDPTKSFHGDIVAPPEAKFPFSVECKAYAKVELYQALYGKSPLFAWWFQCVSDAKVMSHRPMLIFKENRKQLLVAIDSNTYNKIVQMGSITTSILKLRHIELSFRTTKGAKSIYIFELKKFLLRVPAKALKKLPRL